MPAIPRVRAPCRAQPCHVRSPARPPRLPTPRASATPSSAPHRVIEAERRIVPVGQGTRVAARRVQVVGQRGAGRAVRAARRARRRAVGERRGEVEPNEGKVDRALELAACGLREGEALEVHDEHRRQPPHGEPLARAHVLRAWCAEILVVLVEHLRCAGAQAGRAGERVWRHGARGGEHGFDKSASHLLLKELDEAVRERHAPHARRHVLRVAARAPRAVRAARTAAARSALRSSALRPTAAAPATSIRAAPAARRAARLRGVHWLLRARQWQGKVLERVEARARAAALLALDGGAELAAEEVCAQVRLAERLVGPG